MERTVSWSEWKRALAQAVSAGQAAGMGPGEMVRRASQIGDFLARHVDPDNPEQRVLQELWSIADEREQQAIASALVKLAGQAGDDEFRGANF